MTPACSPSQPTSYAASSCTGSLSTTVRFCSMPGLQCSMLQCVRWHPWPDCNDSPCSMLNSAKVGGPCSRLDKMRLACMCHLPKGVEDASLKWAWLTQLARHIQDCWGLDLGITQDAAGKTAPPAALSMAAWASSPAAGSGRHRSVFIDRPAAGQDIVPSPALSGTAYSETQDMRDVSNERMPILIIPPLKL